MMHANSVLFTILATIAASATAGTTVQTLNGTIQCGSSLSSESNYFFSIPFADPPVGALRYEAPQPFTGSYNGTLNGTKQAPNCYQFGNSPSHSRAAIRRLVCLYLYIYAPANATSASGLPVKVWLYGGTYEIGGISDPLYNGCFSSADAIVVTVNYRLGPLGYLALENTTLVGNYGTQDQLQALRWVHDNIAAFGGDPSKVLLFGQSAGATASFALATLPEITSLVNAVVMESGGGVDLPTISTAQRFHAEFVSALNCSVNDIGCVRTKTPDQLNTTFNHLPTNNTFFVFSLDDYFGAAFPWSPQAGSPLFPVQPSQVGVPVPAIFGSNGLEGSLFVLLAFGEIGSQNLTANDYTDFLAVNFGSFASDVNQQYPLSSYNNSVFQAISIVMRDFTFRCSAYRGASLAVAKGLPVWTYSFNQTASCLWDQGQTAQELKILGATHTAEIPNISAFMESAWTSMAGNAMPGDGWPGFSPGSSLGINFQDGVVPGVVDYSMCPFWDKIDPAILQNATAVANGTSGVSESSTGIPGAASSTTGGSASSTGSAPAAYTSSAGTPGASMALLFIVALIMMSVRVSFMAFSLKVEVVVRNAKVDMIG
ncbi:hypothetical protein MMC18_009244 [Xylographa bjoerkii]|nr:hypothetical protein [Xylographa bjoerkii]